MDHKNSIKTFGYGYLIGDAALMTAGVLKAKDEARANDIGLTQTQKFKESIAGGIYATAGIIGARYGNPSTEKKLELLYGDMQKDLQRMGISIPADATPELLAQPNGVIDNMERFLYRHPTQVIHAIFAAGGIPNMVAALPKGESKFNPSVFASGFLITLGGLVGLLLPQKSVDPAHPPEGLGEKLLAKAQENPLNAAAKIFTVNNLFLFTGALADKKDFAHSTTGAQHAWLLKLVTGAAYVTSNYFLSQSQRDNTSAKGEEHEVLVQHLRSTAARLVMAQPEAMRNSVLEQVAGYLASRPEVGEDAKTLAAQMQADIQQLAATSQQHPDAGSWAARAQKPSTPSFDPTR